MLYCDWTELVAVEGAVWEAGAWPGRDEARAAQDQGNARTHWEGTHRFKGIASASADFSFIGLLVDLLCRPSLVTLLCGQLFTTGRNRVRLEELVGGRERWKDITAASMSGRAYRTIIWPDKRTGSTFPSTDTLEQHPCHTHRLCSIVIWSF